jgi:putative two-component system response regulator
LNQSSRKTILIVDDVPQNITIINALLKDEYHTRVATTGAQALALACAAQQPDLILLDIELPEMDGYEVCRILKADRVTREIPVIFLTAKTDQQDEVRGFELGAVDYITKPVSPPVLQARVRTHLMLTEAKLFLRNQNRLLEERVFERTREIWMVQDVTIMALGSLAETRDNETGNHIRRTQNYIRLLALKLQDHPRFRSHLSERQIEALYKSASLHDIGKVGIPDRILLKPGKLTPEEFRIMQTHTTLGRDAIASAEGHLQTGSQFLHLAREIAYSHHEKWDGSGYPLGLSGEDIPASARLMAVADVYDALISKRVYKAAFSHEVAVKIITEGRGTHFDPVIADAFLELADDFRELAARFSDSDEEINRRARISDICPAQQLAG